jgi:hypothetical protein
MTTLIIQHHMGENPLCQCDDCGKYQWFTQTKPIQDPTDRLMAGCETPAGECYVCGSLAYIVDDDKCPCRKETL